MTALQEDTSWQSHSVGPLILANTDMFVAQIPVFGYPKPAKLHFAHPSESSCVQFRNRPTPILCCMFVILVGWSCFLWCCINMVNILEVASHNPIHLALLIQYLSMD